jgi:monoamine oxidase
VETTVAIVGGGLAGLHAARLLAAANIPFQLLEARDRLGGRILSADAADERSPSADGFDLGPSWFWPGTQLALAEIVGALGLPSFPQNSDGDVLVQRMPLEAPRRYRGMPQEPESMRLAGGTGAIVSALASSLPAEAVRLRARVTRVAVRGQAIDVRFVSGTGAEGSLTAAHAILALPPRLLEASVAFSPALDAETARRWRETATWMAPHAKFFAIYDRPFWREAGLSGTAQSMVGPLVEIHDATTASGRAALFGFVGVPAERRAEAGRDAIVAAAVQQLADLFGAQARAPRATLFKDWAADPLTATADDRVGGDHPRPSSQAWVTGEWRKYISLAGSETSRTEPGYLAGAIAAAEGAVADVVSRVATSGKSTARPGSMKGPKDAPWRRPVEASERPSDA